MREDFCFERITTAGNPGDDCVNAIGGSPGHESYEIAAAGGGEGQPFHDVKLGKAAGRNKLHSLNENSVESRLPDFRLTLVPSPMCA